MSADDGFFARLHEAEAAGLNKEWSLKVAYLELSLDDALGAMDTDQESESIKPSLERDGITFCSEKCRDDGGCSECIPFW